MEALYTLNSPPGVSFNTAQTLNANSQAQSAAHRQDIVAVRGTVNPGLT